MERLHARRASGTSRGAQSNASEAKESEELSGEERIDARRASGTVRIKLEYVSA